MAYDEKLAERIRHELGAEPDVTEMKMFGGLAFLVGGNMAVAASGQGGLLVRVDPQMSEKVLATSTARRMENAGPGDGRVAARRRRRCPHQARPREVDQAGDDLRTITASKEAMIIRWGARDDFEASRR